MPTRNAETRWTGSLMDGSGQVTLSSSGLATFDVSFPRRSADDADGVTSPEELIAAAHSSCFAMQFSHLLAEAGGSDIRLTVADAVSLGPDPAGGLRVTGIALTVSGSAAGVDAATFAALAEQAKTGCPVSKALAGTEITLTLA